MLPRNRIAHNGSGRDERSDAEPACHTAACLACSPQLARHPAVLVTTGNSASAVNRTPRSFQWVSSRRNK
jgi:hypothetical protein